jgi:hypothetical protein
MRFTLYSPFTHIRAIAEMRLDDTPELPGDI